jgi:hypothetical protein
LRSNGWICAGNIAKGFHHPARRCRDAIAAAPGDESKIAFKRANNPNKIATFSPRLARQRHLGLRLEMICGR